MILQCHKDITHLEAAKAIAQGGIWQYGTGDNH